MPSQHCQTHFPIADGDVSRKRLCIVVFKLKCALHGPDSGPSCAFICFCRGKDTNQSISRKGYNYIRARGIKLIASIIMSKVFTISIVVVDHVHEYTKESIGMLVQLVEPFTSLGGKGR